MLFCFSKPAHSDVQTGENVAQKVCLVNAPPHSPSRLTDGSRGNNLTLATCQHKNRKAKGNNMTAQLHELWNLLAANDQNTLTDTHIHALLESRQTLLLMTEVAKSRLNKELEQLQKYRAGKKDLQALPIEELQRMHQEVCLCRAVAIEADVADELPDSFFEPPPIDSDQYILSEMLGERKKAKAMAQPS